MGVWMIGTGNISIKPQVDDVLIKEYIQFSKRCIPEAYGEERFPNTWFFDENTDTGDDIMKKEGNIKIFHRIISE